MLKGISDTNTEEQILRSLDVLKDFVLSSCEETKQHFKRVESDIKEFRNDIKEIKESLREMNGRG